MDRSNCLTRADALTGGDRNDSYGHPLEDFSRTAGMVTALLRHKLLPDQAITPEDWAMCMVLCKLSREQNRPKTDNIDDAAGYIRTLEMVKSAKRLGRVYLSGPMTGVKDQNYPAFNIAAGHLRANGYIVTNPAESYGGDPTRERLTYLRKDIEDILCRCDGIVMLPGWHTSTGAKLERQIAMSIGLRVITLAVALEA